jgi:hypothetical protein
MFRLLVAALLACACAFASPALAQKKKGESTRYVPKSQQEADEQPDAPPRKGGAQSRESPRDAQMPRFARCTENCARPQQACSANCKGNSSCDLGCNKTYLSCVQRCGGPIGSDPNGGQGTVSDQAAQCATRCASQMESCEGSCGNRQDCAERCSEQMSACASACD